jgi:hypothetical protein
MIGDEERQRQQSTIDTKSPSKEGDQVHSSTAFLRWTIGAKLNTTTIRVSYTELIKNKPDSAKSMDFPLGRLGFLSPDQP